MGNLGRKSKYNAPAWIGQRFGKLVVLEAVRKEGYAGWYWRCKCDCGNEKISAPYNLLSSHVVSCGCRKKERNHNLTLGADGKTTRLYGIWCNMKQRCNNPSETAYKYYGGRGIRVCDEWQASYPSFYVWAIANGYKDDLTIDRINNDGDYCPDNCRWATMKQQIDNRRTPNNATYQPHTRDVYSIATLRLAGKTYEEIGRELGLSRQRVHQIMQKAIQKIGRDENLCYKTGHAK